ncbi:hypothetical protein Y032_0101g3350 [Ancylostoma ceylanicum]|uniref:Uncharacterized protein n=1 Tax=Ancylostoma ceylanicum TaxID=53326 RepID=A0A016THW4_9BILA|nr:hypothetical protein Y032_0101g3350 [Ancylostoma ceylanicum]
MVLCCRTKRFLYSSVISCDGQLVPGTSIFKHWIRTDGLGRLLRRDLFWKQKPTHHSCHEAETHELE